MLAGGRAVPSVGRSRWIAHALRFDANLAEFDLSTLPLPGSVDVVPLVVDVDPDLVAALERAARLQGVSVEDVVRQRLRGAA